MKGDRHQNADTSLCLDWLYTIIQQSVSCAVQRLTRHCNYSACNPLSGGAAPSAQVPSNLHALEVDYDDAGI